MARGSRSRSRIRGVRSRGPRPPDQRSGSRTRGPVPGPGFPSQVPDFWRPGPPPGPEIWPDLGLADPRSRVWPTLENRQNPRFWPGSRKSAISRKTLIFEKTRVRTCSDRSRTIENWVQNRSIFGTKIREFPDPEIQKFDNFSLFRRVENRRFSKTVENPVLSATKKKGHECQKNDLFFLDGRKFFPKHPPFGPALGRSSGKRFSLESGLIKDLPFFWSQKRWPFFEIWSKSGGPGAGFLGAGLGSDLEVRNGWKTGFGTKIRRFWR